MKRSPEELEKLIHETLRSLPERRAPRSLEARVMAAVAAREALPWWRQSYRAWPMAARVAFLVLSGSLAFGVMVAAVWVMADFRGSDLAQVFATPLLWIELVRGAVAGLAGFCAILVRQIPPLWLYGGLALFAAMYATLFGIGAAAYRTLIARR